MIEPSAIRPEYSSTIRSTCGPDYTVLLTSFYLDVKRRKRLALRSPSTIMGVMSPLPQAPGQRVVRRSPRTTRFLWTLLFLALVTPYVWIWYAVAQLRATPNREHLFWLVCHTAGTSQERSDAFLELAQLRNTEWRSAQLEGLDLSGVDLANVVLAEVNLEGCKLNGTKLAGAVLNRSRLRTSDLSGADLSGADLREADLGGNAVLTDANLSFADLRGAILDEARARGARFSRANLAGAHLTMAELSSADFEGANLAGAGLYVANLHGARLAGANLSGADLRRVVLTNANWWRTRGLTPELVAAFVERFPPSAEASAELRADYEEWRSQRGKP